MSESLAALLIALADDELILGHRHSEWTGFAPHMEEDVAFSSIAQDEIGHAAAFYSLASEITRESPDRMALGRLPEAYRHAIICELGNKDWAYTLARHWIYDSADALRLECLEHSKHAKLAQLAVKIRREERYHLLHAEMWINRLAEGPVEGRTMIADALSDALTQAMGLFEPFELEAAALDEGWLPTSSDELKDRWLDDVWSVLDHLGLAPDAHRKGSSELVASSSGDLIEADNGAGSKDSGVTGLGGRRGLHSEEFGALWNDMTVMFRAHPGATW